MINLTEFRGERWGLDTFKNGPPYADYAHDVYLSTTGLDPIKRGKKQFLTETRDYRSIKTFFHHYDSLVTSTDKIQMASSPVVDDVTRRLYFEGNGYLWFLPHHEINYSIPTNLSLSHVLGVKAPTESFLNQAGDPLGLIVSYDTSTPADGNYLDPEYSRIVESAYLVYTYVTVFGEESAPSYPSNQFEYIPNKTKFNIFGMRRSTDPDILGVRVYISINNEFYRIASPTLDRTVQHTADQEQTINGLTFLHGYHSVTGSDTLPVLNFTATNQNIGNVLVSYEWYPPPSGIKHFIITRANFGIAASEDTIYFSERNYIHAWPPDYRLKVKGKVVGLVEIVGGAAVMTDRGCHIYAIGSPAQVQEMQFYPHPCVDPDSIDTHEGSAIYVSYEGIIHISLGSGGQVITDSWISRDTWIEQVKVSEAKTGVYEGHIVLMTRNALGFAQGYLFNLQHQYVTRFTVTEVEIAVGFYRHPKTGELWHITDDKGIAHFNEGDPVRATWISGRIELPENYWLTTARSEVSDYRVIDTGIDVDVGSTEEDVTIDRNIVSAPKINDAFDGYGGPQLILDIEGDEYRKPILNNKPYRIKKTARKRWVRVGHKTRDRVSFTRLGTDIGDV